MTDNPEPTESVEPNDGAEMPSPENSEVEIQSPEFQELGTSPIDPTTGEIDRFRDIKISISAELGRTELPIQALLALGPGSILELERSIDGPVELITQGVPLAKGEVVVVNDCFAIRVTEIYPNFKPKQAG